MKKKIHATVFNCFMFFFTFYRIRCKKTETNEFLSNIQRFESSENSKITDRCRYSEIELRRKRKFHRVQYKKNGTCELVMLSLSLLAND